MNDGIGLLERVCLQIYTTSSADERKQAESVIINLIDDPECLQKCQLLLDRASTPYSQSCAATTLTKLISKPSSTLPIEKRIEIKNYVLQYLFDRYESYNISH